MKLTEAGFNFGASVWGLPVLVFDIEFWVEGVVVRRFFYHIFYSYVSSQVINCIVYIFFYFWSLDAEF